MLTHHNLISHSRRTHPSIWCAAIVCTICTTIVIITGITICIGYLIIRPKIPSVSITYAHLDTFDSSQTGVLSTQLTLWFKAQNDNHDANARFSHWVFDLSFHGVKIAKLKNLDFTVNKSDSTIFTYVVKSESVPLDPRLMVLVDLSVRSNRILFELEGGTRTKWRVGPIKSVKFWLHLNCELMFQIDGTSVDSDCSSKKS